MEFIDDDLRQFGENGAGPLPDAWDQSYLENAGARIWYASYGAGTPVILLHGGLGHSGNWGYQVPALRGEGFRVVLMDSRGHGRSTRDERPYSYDLMGSDVLKMMDALGLERAFVVGWSDGACTALVLARQFPQRVAGVFYFACNVTPDGVKQLAFEADSALARCFERHRKDYVAMSATPGRFQELIDALAPMQRSQPGYTADELGEIRAPVVIAHAERDEFIRREHAEYLARNIPGAEFVPLRGVSHFAPLQRPELFNREVLRFLSRWRTE